MLKNRRVLFVSYNGMLDPLGQSQVLPYLRELAASGIQFSLLSFERPAAFAPEGVAKCEKLRRELAGENINWYWLRYHQKWPLPATVYDVVSGVLYGAKLVRRGKIEMVHARGQIPATIALVLKKILGLKLIFDVRGLMAEEYFDAGHWRQGSFPYRLTKTVESRALAAADGVVTLTERIWPLIKDWKGLGSRDVVHETIPCCTDLELFKFQPKDRALRRSELGVDSRFVLVYSGSIDGWYLTESMADFFVSLKKFSPTAHFLWLTPSRHDRVRDLMRARGLADCDYTVVAAASRDVPSYLAASDAGLAFIKPCFSKLASSPTKTGEYLACGLPLIINAGIGDSDALITSEKIGALVRELNAPEYERAATTILEFAQQPEETRRRARAVATKLFDVRRVGIERYARLYERVLADPRAV